MMNWISLKKFSNPQAAQNMKVYLQCHGVLARIQEDEIDHSSKLLVQLVQTEKAQKLIHS